MTIRELKRLIDRETLIQAIEKSWKTIPAESRSELYERPSVSVLQLTYAAPDPDVFSISKIYVSISPVMELAFNSDYELTAMNVIDSEDDSRILSYSSDGQKLAEYEIDRDALYKEADHPYMTKTNGDLYQTSREDAGDMEAVKNHWVDTGKLLCFSFKTDGRACFYITIDSQLQLNISNSEEA